MKIIGHLSQRKRLADLNRLNKLPNAIILAGAPGIGKSLVAGELASAILCDGPLLPDITGGCGVCDSCRLLKANNHPDYLVRDLTIREEADLASFRNLLGLLSLKPYRERHRVITLKQVESMSTPVANILLKSIEEPPRGTFFILTTDSLARVISTILSRCQKVTLSELKPDEIKAILEASSLPDDASRELLVTLARTQGSFAGMDTLARLRDTWDELTELLIRTSMGSQGSALEVVEMFQRQKAIIPELITMCRLYGRHQTRNAATSSERLRWANFLRNLLTAEWMIKQRNINSSLALTTICLGLAKASVPVVTSRDPSALERTIPL